MAKNKIQCPGYVDMLHRGALIHISWKRSGTGISYELIVGGGKLMWLYNPWPLIPANQDELILKGLERQESHPELWADLGFTTEELKVELSEHSHRPFGAMDN